MTDEPLDLIADDEPAEHSSSHERGLSVISVLAVVIVLTVLGSYLLTLFIKSRPVDLVRLTEDNELRVVEILPRLGDVTAVSHEDSRDQYAIWRTYRVQMQKYPEVRVDRACDLIRRSLNNPELVVKAEKESDRLNVISLSCLGYVTHRIEMNTSPFLEPLDVVSDEPLAKAAIIVDDLGYSRKFIDEWFSIEAPLTFAILPRLPLGPRVAESARKKGYEVLLHLPLEGNPEAPVSDGTLTVDMDAETIRTEFYTNIDSVPHAVGVNNHQGSVFTSDYAAMSHLMPLLRESGLFFVDSHTSGSSVVERVAEEHDVKHAVNSTFLDNIDEEEYVQEQMTKLMSAAREHGSAIGVCHVNRRSSLEVCSRSMSLFAAKGIELVPVSELVR